MFTLEATQDLDIASNSASPIGNYGNTNLKDLIGRFHMKPRELTYGRYTQAWGTHGHEDISLHECTWSG